MNNNQKYILVTTPNRCFQFISTINKTKNLSIEELFDYYNKHKLLNYIELPLLKNKMDTFSNDNLTDKLLLLKNYKSKPSESFIWLTNGGIVHGNLINSIELNSTCIEIIKEKELIKLSNPIQSIQMTNYHILLLLYT